MHKEDSILLLSNITIGYQSGHVSTILIKDLSLSALKGKLICIIGKNGIGKSTLIRTIAGIQKPLAGEILIEESNIHTIDLKQLACKLSIVYTDKIEAENLRVFDLIAMGRFPYLSWLGTLSDNDKNSIEKAISLSHIEPLQNRYFSSLSDGEKQKVMIARAIAQDTPIILLDEPTSHLDISGRLDVFITLKKLCEQENKTILLSTHQLDCALQFADYIWLLTGDKKIISEKSNDTLMTKAIGQEFNSDYLKFDEVNGVFKYIEKTIRK